MSFSFIGLTRLCAGAASGSADADKKEKAPKGGTAVKVTFITFLSKAALQDSHVTRRDDGNVQPVNKFKIKCYCFPF